MQGQRVLPEEGTGTPRPVVCLPLQSLKTPSMSPHLPQTLLFKSLQRDQFYLQSPAEDSEYLITHGGMVLIDHSEFSLLSPGTGPWMLHCTLMWSGLTLSLFGNGGTLEIRDRDYQQIRRYTIFFHTQNHIVGQQLITVLLTSYCDLSCFPHYCVSRGN